MNRKHEQSIYHANLNVNLMVENIAQIKSGITINVNVTVRTWKNPFTCTRDSSEYLASITDNSGISCDQIIEETKTTLTKEIPRKTVSTNFKEKMLTCDTKDLYILLTFLLITIASLIVVNIWCYLIKYQAKQKYL